MQLNLRIGREERRYWPNMDSQMPSLQPTQMLVLILSYTVSSFSLILKGCLADIGYSKKAANFAVLQQDSAYKRVPSCQGL